MIPVIIIRYGELTTKNKNRIDFIKQLKINVQYSLKDFLNIKIIHFYDRMEIINFSKTQSPIIIKMLTKVFGISSLSVAFKIEKDMAILAQKTLQLVQSQDLSLFQTFKLFVCRIDKTFALTSTEIVSLLAKVILDNTKLVVAIKQPQLKINIKVNNHDIYLFANKIIGIGGLPVGSSGKILLLLSGGIDSPVAAYKLMKRGLEVQYLHFTSSPFITPAVLKKVQTLVTILKTFNAGNDKLFICNFTNLQNEISHINKESYRIILMRRMFIRIANMLAKEHKIQALATGESLGQVASQTLASVNCINSVAKLPILRSLITQDKIDIIETAKKIGTYETSILPFADCCSLFVPKNPIIQPKVKACEMLEKQLQQLIDWEQLLINTCHEIKQLV